jgi:two-component system, OmpR family, response regulator VicR
MKTAKPSVLVVDDERRYRDLIELNLTRRGYRVLVAADGLAALNVLESDEIDLVLLDLLLPDMDGYEMCRRIRADSSVPIIVVTAKADESSKVRGLGMGADDYVTKPFWAEELVARVSAVLRRGSGRSDALRAPFVNGDLLIDFSQHQVIVRGQEVHLTPHEYSLLYHLAQNAGRVLVHEELLRRVWGLGYEDQPEILHTTVRRLRRKLEDNPSAPRYVVTRRSIGYLLALIAPAPR